MRRAKRTRSVSDVVQLLARRSWDDDLGDDDRIIMELACNTIKQLDSTILAPQVFEPVFLSL